MATASQNAWVVGSMGAIVTMFEIRHVPTSNDQPGLIYLAMLNKDLQNTSEQRYFIASTAREAFVDNAVDFHPLYVRAVQDMPSAVTNAISKMKEGTKQHKSSTRGSHNLMGSGQSRERLRACNKLGSEPPVREAAESR